MMQLTTTLIQIGNSRGIRIPSKIVHALGLGEDINLEVKSDKLIITPFKKKPRLGWAEMFNKTQSGTEQVLPEDLDIKLVKDLPW